MSGWEPLFIKMKNEVIILGAGMAGLLAANILRRHDVTVLEKSEGLPDNHKALLRFRSHEVSDATGIPFERVQVAKGLWDGERVVSEATLLQQNRYSLIVTGGEVHARSLSNLRSVEDRFIAPKDFVQQMAKNVNIGFKYKSIDLSHRKKWDDVLISTIPMPVLMKLLKWDDIPNFQYSPIWTVRARITHPIFKVHQTLYNVNDEEWYRATIHGDQLTLEYAFDPDELFVAGLSGINAESAVARFFCQSSMSEGWGQRWVPEWSPKVTDVTLSKQPFGKILPIPEDIRRKFIIWASDKFNIFSLGRFATWRPLLLDDLVWDIKKIETMITHGNYKERMK